MDISEISRMSPAAQKQILEKLQPAKRSKYGNQKTKVDGITFDSKKEAERYRELMAMQKAGKIRDLHLQQEFVLQSAYTLPGGDRVRSIKYVADFTYKETEAWPDSVWVRVVEDVKSEATRKNRVYIMKKKMMQEKFGITIREV